MASTPGLTLRLGTRGSALAQWQARWVAAQLASRGMATELVLISTEGDQQQGSIGTLGLQGVFTKEIQRALLEGQVDLAVHSLKDLPTEAVPGLSLSAVPLREAVGDVLVSRDAARLETLPEGARVGTGSTRRRAQLLHVRPDLQVLDLRGNVDTRLRKLDEGQYDAIILAEAGLRRLGWSERIGHVIAPSQMLPAVGQGALGLETRQDDQAARTAVGLLDDPPSHAAVLAERALLAALRGGCLAPVGAWARVEADRLRLTAAVLSADGRTRLFAEDAVEVRIPAEGSESGEAAREAASVLGIGVAEQLLGQGAAELIAQSRPS